MNDMTIDWDDEYERMVESEERDLLERTPLSEIRRWLGDDEDDSS